MATVSRGTLNYYKLTKSGFAVLHGECAKPPTKRYFDSISITRQHHTRCLADFLVHTLVAGHQNDVKMTGFCFSNPFT